MNNKNIESDDNLIMVLNDGKTFSPLQGSMIVSLPDSVVEVDDVEKFLKEGDYDHFHIGEIKDSDTVMRWMRVFFPDMQVLQDEDGQIVIHTGIIEKN